LERLEDRRKAHSSKQIRQRNSSLGSEHKQTEVDDSTFVSILRELPELKELILVAGPLEAEPLSPQEEATPCELKKSQSFGIWEEQASERIREQTDPFEIGDCITEAEEESCGLVFSQEFKLPDAPIIEELHP